MDRPRTLAQYPWVVVRLDCVLCPRKGCYRLARLAAQYGPEQSLDGLLADLAHDCPWWRSHPRKYEARCGARFVDLERNLPPPDDPDVRAVPKRRLVSAGAGGPAPMLSAWDGAVVVVTCSRCGRRDTFVKADLLMNGGDARLTDLLKRLTADCQRAAETAIYELCQARFEV